MNRDLLEKREYQDRLVLEDYQDQEEIRVTLGQWVSLENLEGTDQEDLRGLWHQRELKENLEFQE